MKKVRCIVGAVGVAPALVMTLPAGNAVAGVAHTAVATGKTVSLAHHKVVGPLNTGDCPGPNGEAVKKNGALLEHAEGTVDGACFSLITGSMSGTHTSLDMRTRFYFNGSQVGADHFNTPVVAGGNTTWLHTTTTGASQACIALVEAAHHSVKKYGPICINATSLTVDG